MKVAFLSFEFPEYCVRLAAALAAKTELMLLLPERDTQTYLPLIESRIHVQQFCKPRLRQALQQTRMIMGLLQKIQSFKPDVIHFQQGHLWFNFALPRLKRYPLILTVHDPIHHLGDTASRKTPQIVMQFGYRRANQIIVHGEKLKQIMTDRYSMAGSKVHVIPHVALGNPRVQSHVTEQNSRILFFGRIWPYKGLEYLIRAEPLITSRIPEAVIVIAGEGEDFTRYRRKMVHPERFVVYNQFVSDELATQLFSSAGVVVLPYVEASQSGVVPLAYRFGKPVVATSVGSLPESVEDGKTGYIVSPRDEEALAGAIVTILKNKQLREQLGANGKRKLEREFAPEIVARQTLAVYERSLAFQN